MKTTVVRYKVKPDRVEDNQALIRNVFSELEKRGSEDIRYVSFRLDDGVTFVHVAVDESDESRNPLTALPAFREFVTDIASRCDEPPVAAAAEMVGSFRLVWQKSADGR